MKNFYQLFIALITVTTLSAQDNTANQISRINDLPFDPALVPFYHGVASGDPLSDAVVIWTRVTPEDMSVPVDVDFYISTDPEMENIIQNGTVQTDDSRDYTVKIDVKNLDPDMSYYYRFEALEKTSIIGRTKTAPVGTESHVRLAVVSCSNYQAGYFNAYARLAERADLDAVIHLGDYIYEYAGGAGTYGYDKSRMDRSNLPEEEIIELADYRTRHSLYKLDPDLRAVHQQHPFIAIWDDHEFANDAYKDGAQNHNAGEGDWNDRKANAKQVYAEWMPIRDENTNPLYRTIKYGDLLDMIMLDTRVEGRDEQIDDVADVDLYSQDRTILGDTQKAWFLDELQNSNAQWKIIGNQVIFSEFHVGWASALLGADYNYFESLFLDIWDGYPAERNEIIEFISDNNIDNTIIITGDFHTTFAFDVSKFPSELSLLDPLNTNQEVLYDKDSKEGSIAVEFSVPSITSDNFDEILGASFATIIQDRANTPLADNDPNFPGVIPNPHLRYIDLIQHGYYVLDITEEKAQADYFFVDMLNPDSEEQTEGGKYFTRSGENYLNESDQVAAPKSEYAALAPELPFGVSTVQEKSSDFVVFNIHPNPIGFDKRLFVEFALVENKELSFDLYALNGQHLLKLKQENFSSGHLTTILRLDSNINAGQYVLVISDGKNQYAKTIFVN